MFIISLYRVRINFQPEYIVAVQWYESTNITFREKLTMKIKN